MPDWLLDFFGINNLFNLAQSGWNFFMLITYSMIGKTPENYSPGAWSYVTDTLYPWFLAIGLTLLNIFCMIGFIRQASNLKENVTIEMWIELFIKVIIANVLMSNGISLMQDIMSMGGTMSSTIMSTHFPSVYSSEMDIGAVLVYLVFGLIYSIAAAVCGGMILLEVMGRYLNLYMLVAVSPVALSTIAGGRGLDSAAHAWIKSFLTTVFQIVVIAIVLQIGDKMMESSAYVDATSTPLDWFDGAGSVMMSFITMIFLTTAVKGADGFLKRAFDLR